MTCWPNRALRLARLSVDIGLA